MAVVTSPRRLPRLGIKRRWVAVNKRVKAIRALLTPPEYPGMKLTPKRLLNFYLVSWEHARGHTKVRGYPLTLTIESTNACNLRCPYCFTGAGEDGREKQMLQMPLYEKVMDELGDRLMQIEFYNWGEPLLNKSIFAMIEKASSKGISTIISTNFSIPFDEERAEKLVRSGLHTLGVSLDGATQVSYEQYRRRGDLDLALRNCALVRDAKKRLGSSTPELVWEFHIFPHNRHEVDLARRMSDELEMTFAASKGWVAGPDWDIQREFEPVWDGTLERCSFLWRRAVVNSDGTVAPCCAVFYKEDDYGRLATPSKTSARGEPAVALSEMAYKSFREVWNNQQFVDSRRMFTDRDSVMGAARDLVCYDCPVTITQDSFRKHLASGGSRMSFERPFGSNEGFNFFFDRRPERGAPPTATRPGEELIALVEPPIH